LFSLDEPFSVICTDELAKNFFGEANPVGKVLSMQFSYNREYQFKITGIIENIRELAFFLSLFWLIIPLTTVLALMGLSFLKSSFYIALPISFIPSILAYKLSLITHLKEISSQ